MTSDPPSIIAKSGRPEDVVLAYDKSTAPLRTALQKRSNFGWLDEAHRAVTNYGIDPDVATGVLDLLVNRPGAAGRVGRSAGLEDVRQAVLFILPDDPATAVYAELAAAVRSGLPPEVVSIAVDLLPVDLEDGRVHPADLVAIAFQLEATYGFLQLREPTPNPVGPRRALMVGNADVGYRDVPPDWQTRLQVTAATLGLSWSFGLAPREVRAQNLIDTADFAVSLGPKGDDWQTLLAEIGLGGLPLVRVGQLGESFADLHVAVRQHLVNVVWAAAVPPPGELPELDIGQSVYHRKVSTSVKFDHFDAGSDSPCIHGESAFTRFTGADKASKGMQRRYANFEPEMLLHCKHFPNCGMYAVRRHR